jgi:DNA-binding LacI/PurR family transcriptional regulator
MNIGEIARLAGVSRSTLSYALSGRRSVSEETKRRI